MASKTKTLAPHSSNIATLELSSAIENVICHPDNVLELKGKLTSLLGENASPYWHALSQYLSGRLIRAEFDLLVKSYLGAACASLHNTLIFTILRNAYLSHSDTNTQGWMSSTPCSPQKRKAIIIEDQKTKMRRIVSGLNKETKDRIRIAGSKTDIVKGLTKMAANKHHGPLKPKVNLASPQYTKDYKHLSMTPSSAALGELPDKSTLRDRMLTICYENEISVLHEEAIEYMSIAIDNYIKSLLHSIIHKRLPKYTSPSFLIVVSKESTDIDTNANNTSASNSTANDHIFGAAINERTSSTDDADGRTLNGHLSGEDEFTGPQNGFLNSKGAVPSDNIYENINGATDISLGSGSGVHSPPITATSPFLSSSNHRDGIPSLSSNGGKRNMPVKHDIKSLIAARGPLKLTDVAFAVTMEPNIGSFTEEIFEIITAKLSHEIEDDLKAEPPMVETVESMDI